jgi:hypothetical protein
MIHKNQFSHRAIFATARPQGMHQKRFNFESKQCKRFTRINALKEMFLQQPIRKGCVKSESVFIRSKDEKLSDFKSTFKRNLASHQGAKA